MKPKTFLQTKAYEYIKEQILNNTFQKEILYSETKLSQDIGVSRTPMREALQCLSQDGYINILPSRGFTIRDLNEKDMIETIQVRCAIEGFCTYLIAQEISQNLPQTKELLRALKSSLDSMVASKDLDDNYSTFIHYDHQFHLLLVNYVNNEEFCQIYQKLMYQIQLTSKSALSVTGRIESTLKEHTQFYECLELGQKDAAYTILIQHLSMPEKMQVSTQHKAVVN